MTEMGDISGQLEELKTTGTAQLLELYKDHFGGKAAPENRIFLVRQFAYRMQEQGMGGISPAVRAKIRELIQTYDPINKIAVKTRTGKTATGRDGRLPMPGSFITKVYKGRRIEVKVLENGFEYQGAIYKNLSAVAKAVTGDHWNGYMFFGLKRHG